MGVIPGRAPLVPPPPPAFPVGTRVRLSALGRRRLNHRRVDPDRLGTVVGTARSGNPAVRWDGQSKATRENYHPGFLVPVPDAPPPPEGGA
jgi:hypothetical protein